MKKEKDRIALGSLDIYMIAFASNAIADIPSDVTLETEENLIGRTKDGGTLTYTSNYYSVKSDDGKAARNELTEDSATLDFGIITWNGDTIAKLVETARTSISGGKRRTLIGGVDNKNDNIYLIRAVHKDKVKGDVRYTMLGKNVNGFAAAYKPGQECTISPQINAEPFSDGTLIVKDEENAIGIDINQTAVNVTVGGDTVTLTAGVAPANATITWASSDTDNATVSSSGVVTAVAAGTATITASITVDGTTYTDTCIVNVAAGT